MNNQNKRCTLGSKLYSRSALHTVNLLVFHRFFSSTISLSLPENLNADNSNPVENSDTVKQMLHDMADMEQRDAEGGSLTSVKGKELVRYDPNSVNVKHDEFTSAQNNELVKVEDVKHDVFTTAQNNELIKVDSNFVRFESDLADSLCMRFDNDTMEIHVLTENDAIQPHQIFQPTCFGYNGSIPRMVFTNLEHHSIYLENNTAELLRRLFDPEIHGE